MKLSKDDKLLKSSLLSDIEGNIKTLNGTAKTYTDGQEVSALTLIDESIQELAELKDLLKGGRVDGTFRQGRAANYGATTKRN